MKRRYFVSYTYWRNDGKSTQGIACTQIERDAPIVSFDDLKGIMKDLEALYDMELVVINSWQPFEVNNEPKP